MDGAEDPDTSTADADGAGGADKAEDPDPGTRGANGAGRADRAEDPDTGTTGVDGIEGVEDIARAVVNEARW